MHIYSTKRRNPCCKRIQPIIKRCVWSLPGLVMPGNGLCEIISRYKLFQNYSHFKCRLWQKHLNLAKYPARMRRRESGSECELELEMKVIRMYTKISQLGCHRRNVIMEWRLVSSCPSLMIIAFVSQFNVYWQTVTELTEEGPSRGLSRDCEMFGILRITFASSSSVNIVIASRGVVCVVARSRGVRGHWA